MNHSPILALAAVLTLAACSGEAPQPAPSDAAETATPVAEAPGASEAAPPASSSDPAATPSPTAPASALFPPAMAGRWGLVPADCTSLRGDNKGMITLTAREIRFYESVARIAAIKESGATRLRATLAYEGEGMEWSRDALLEAKPASDQLVMEEFGADAVPGPRTYTRCK